MLTTRIITALVLLAVLVPVLFFGPYLAIIILSALFFAASCWEGLRLFGYRLIIPVTLAWTILFIWLFVFGSASQLIFIWIVSCLAWIVIFIPSLKLGLPNLNSNTNRLMSVLYLISILACFLAILSFQQRSSLYLLSVLAIVWVADIGAYSFGKAFGKRKLAPTISPGKSWEGAIGGWLLVLAFGIGTTLACAYIPSLSESFSVRLQQSLGWLGLCVALTGLTIASVIGDLAESQLKRRVKMKDSSHLLPGHGGVLDRIDSLIFVLPLAMLIEMVMKIPTNS